VNNCRTQSAYGSYHDASAGIAFEPGDELLELQLVKSLADRVELAGAVHDELTALLDEVERLPQAGLSGIEAADDLLDAGDRGLVRTDLRTFGQFAEFSSIGHALLADAGRISGSTSDELRTQGESDLGVARYLGKQIRWLNYAYDPSSPGTNPNLRPDGSYQPGHPYNSAVALDAAENADPALHGLSPVSLHKQALTLRSQAVHLTGIAAIFVGVLMLFTLAAVVPGSPKVLFAGSGTVLGVVGAILFLLVVA
jgi:hypothetical protein